MIEPGKLHARVSAALAAIAVSAVAGCSGSPTTHYLTLSAVPVQTASAPGSRTPISGPQGGVAIGVITLPQILDRPELARRVGPNQLDYSEFDKWAASLDDLVRHALAEDLSAELGVQILPSVAASDAAPHRILRLDIDSYEADAAGAVTLAAHWSVSDPNATHGATVSENAHLSSPSQGSSAEALAHTMSAALGDLAHRIAETIQAPNR